MIAVPLLSRANSLDLSTLIVQQSLWIDRRAPQICIHASRTNVCASLNNCARRAQYELLFTLWFLFYGAPTVKFEAAIRRRRCNLLACCYCFAVGGTYLLGWCSGKRTSRYATCWRWTCCCASSARTSSSTWGRGGNISPLWWILRSETSYTRTSFSSGMQAFFLHVLCLLHFFLYFLHTNIWCFVLFAYLVCGGIFWLTFPRSDIAVVIDPFLFSFFFYAGMILGLCWQGLYSSFSIFFPPVVCRMAFMLYLFAVSSCSVIDINSLLIVEWSFSLNFLQ